MEIILIVWMMILGYFLILVGGAILCGVLAVACALGVAFETGRVAVRWAVRRCSAGG